jgi:hypothetical protein
MSTTVKILLAVLVLGLAGAGLFFANYVSANNYGSRSEALLEASYQDNQNVYSNYTARVAEMAQVPSMYRKDLEKVIRADVEGRYGTSGSSATMQWIQERQLPFDSSLYTRLQQTMEAGRNEFANNQRRMLDIKKDYVAAQGYFLQGFFLRLAEYPKVDMNKYLPVTTAQTQEVFRTGTDTPIQLPKE